MKQIAWQQIASIGNIILIFISFLIVPIPAFSQSFNRDSGSAKKTQPSSSDLPTLPENGAPTGRREGGASRNGCPTLNQKLTAIVPGTEELGRGLGSSSKLATTISEYPTFWVYLPQLTPEITLGEFIIQDEVGKDIYRQSINLPQDAGVIGVKPPSSPEYALALNQKYHWYFRVFCDSSPTQAEYIYVDSWIQRVSFGSTVDSELKAQKPANYLDYVDRDLWYDSLTNLALLRDRNPQNSQYKDDWTSLLQLLGLENLAPEPILFHYDRES